jgi:hypothetical protein
MEVNMIKALRVVMIAWAVVGILFGLGFILVPEQMVASVGFQSGPPYVPYFLGLLGMAYVVSGVFVIMAARDPLKDVRWVKLALAWTLLDIVAVLYHIIRGNVTFGQAGFVLFIDGIFTILFLVFYPWRAAQNTDRTQD